MVTIKDKLATVTTTFVLKNATPGAFRYDEVNEQGTVLKGDGDGAVIGTLYLRKKAMNDKCMKKFKVVITEIAED